MSISRLTTLAFSLYSNKGTFAVLLGSGISRPAHILSAWEVEEVLIERLAATQGVMDEKDWHEWYKKQFGKEADYSTLLDELVSTKTERVGLMRGFFEPSDTDNEMGWKKPTIAHASIAKLAKDGYVKVILTTNFDRLMENALAQEGVAYQVVLHESDLGKITPLTHSNIPTIVKINGDYIDCRFRNTASELADYPDELKKFLSRIFEDYGLITCGWSATWDVGLVDIITSSAVSRYNSFFAYVGASNKDLNSLAEKRCGETFQIKDGDMLFKDLYEQVDALNRSNVSRSLGKDILLARVKKYIADKKFEIEYDELIDDLADEAYNRVQKLANYNFSLTRDRFNYYLEQHREAVKSLMEIAIYVGKWGKPAHVKKIGNVIVRLCLLPWKNGRVTSGYTNYIHGIAATLLLNALGVSCVHYSNFAGLNEVVKMDVPSENFLTYNMRHKLLYMVGDGHLGRDVLNSLLGQNYYYPYSILLLKELEPFFEKEFDLASEYESTFYIWEHLKSLLYGYHKCIKMNDLIIPVGHFTRYGAEAYFREKESNPYCLFFDSADELKDNWPPVKHGMFGGKYANYKSIHDKAAEYYKNHWIVG